MNENVDNTLLYLIKIMHYEAFDSMQPVQKSLYNMRREREREKRNPFYTYIHSISQGT